MRFWFKFCAIIQLFLLLSNQVICEPLASLLVGGIIGLVSSLRNALICPNFAEPKQPLEDEHFSING
jgi:hypothetical protein